MDNFPIDTLSDVSLTDSEPGCEIEVKNILKESPTSASRSGGSPVFNFDSNKMKRLRKRKKKIFNGDESVCNDPEMKKWWRRRYDLFQRFDEGIQMDKESWYSVTPEEIARRQAQVCACHVIVDGFAGAGGNSIQFAQTCSFVIGIDNFMDRLDLLDNNARVYGVKHRIDVICGDLERILRAFRQPTSSSVSVFELNSSREDTPSSSINVLDNISTKKETLSPTVDVLETNSLSEQTLHSSSTTLEVLACNISKEQIPSKSSTGSELQTTAGPIDAIFVSPPWGGQSYARRVLPPGSGSWNKKRRKQWFQSVSDSVLDEEDLEPAFSLEADEGDVEGIGILLPGVIRAARALTSRVAVYLPRNTCLGHMLKLGWAFDTLQPLDVTLEDYWVRGRRLAVCAYLGIFPLQSEQEAD